MVKKTFFLIALTVCLVLVATAYKSGYNRNIAIGRPAPEMPLAPVDIALRNAAGEGKYVLLSFWTSSDAASRKACNDYTAWQNSHHDPRLEIISVNFDKTLPLFEEIVRLDSLPENNQFNVTGQQADVIKTRYDLKRGFGSVLISPEGKIVAHNPLPANLAVLTR